MLIQCDSKRWTQFRTSIFPELYMVCKDFIFQQDGVPPHWHRDVRRFMNESLPQQWIGRVSKEDLALQFWPLRSPTLTPRDFFLWGFVKEAVINNFGRPKKPYHNCGELSDTRHSSLGVERIQLPSRCYPCSRRWAH
jgi:hypothetical protein